MTEDREVIVQDAAAPRWIGIVIVALAVVSLVALGAGWSASTHAKALEQSLADEAQKAKQDEDMLNQRLAKAEDTNTQLEGELSVVANKVKVTQGQLSSARMAAKKAKEDGDKELADLQNNVNGQLATKASVDDVNKVGSDVTAVKSDLETEKNNLQMARGEFGTLIAKNHDEINELRRLGERDYYEFTINKKGEREKVGNLMVELHGTNTKKNQFSVAIFVDDQRHEKKNLTINEPLYFFQNGSRSPLEFVVNTVGKDKIVGYLSVPKASTPATQASGN